MMYYGTTSATSTYTLYRHQYIQDVATHADQGMTDAKAVEYCKHQCNDYELPNKINQKEFVIDVIKYFRDSTQRSLQTAFRTILKEHSKKLQTH